jgi:hypothetical protein
MIDLNECRKKLSDFMARDPKARFSLDTAIHSLCEWIYTQTKEDLLKGVRAIQLQQQPSRFYLHRGHVYEDREDGLAVCTCCGGAEGALPSSCPGYKIPGEAMEAIYSGVIDYNNGTWWICVGQAGFDQSHNSQAIDALIALGKVWG